MFSLLYSVEYGPLRDSVQGFVHGTPAQPQQSGMCACCRNMAMMRGGQQGGTGGHGGMHMPGMEPPKPQ